MHDHPTLVASYKVRNHDIDAYGHVNNAAYLRIIEDTMVDMFDERGIHLIDLGHAGVSVYMKEIAITYVRPAFFGDVLTVTTWFEKLSRVKMLWKNEIIRSETGEVLTRVAGCAVFVKNDGRVIAIPERVRMELSKYVVKRSTHESA